ncbi:NAD(P)H-binding protein [Nevskia ramosa]|uniref:NAD(P)H-binding protein n=1 Tax=Nevskia ramosa TaxID=64002 RepID=UPI002353EDC2|nr:NAD(P)H-binding protein [Nevskia ramosa]
MARIALLVGATGLVGTALLDRLLAAPEYATVIVLGRRAPTLGHAKLRFVQSTLENLDDLADPLVADDLFCCLGTTTKAAGGNAGLERVDYTMVLAVARAAQASGVTRFFGVSAAGVSPTSLAFYSRLKARMEQDVAAVGFASTQFFRPSLLLGARSESRPAEAFGQKLAPLLSPLCVGPLRKYRPITAEEVADAMLLKARGTDSGVQVHALPL